MLKRFLIDPRSGKAIAGFRRYNRPIRIIINSEGLDNNKKIVSLPDADLSFDNSKLEVIQPAVFIDTSDKPIKKSSKKKKKRSETSKA